MDRNHNEKPDQLYLEELLRQVSSQSTLLAGFSFAGLTINSTNCLSTADYAFTILAGTSMGLQILALSISGILLAAFKFNPKMDVKWKKHFDICWGCYLFGLIALLFSLPLIVHIKIPALTIPASIFSLVIFFTASMQFQVIFKKTKTDNETTANSR